MSGEVLAPPGETRSARAALRAGDLDAAQAAFAARLRADPQDATALFGMSAIMRRQRRDREARRLLKEAARARPIERHADADPGHAILRPRCIDAANFCAVRRRGNFETRFKGGHFSLSNLLEDEKRNLVTVNLVNGDPAPLYKAGPAWLLLNPIACADRSGASLKAISAFLRDRPELPVINRPEAVARTTRDGNYRRLSRIPNVEFPVTLRLSPRDGEDAFFASLAKAGLSLPLIVRATGRQTGRQMFLCTSPDELRRAVRSLQKKREIYVIAYNDCRVDARFHHKARAFFIDGKVYPVAWLSSDAWQIHSGDRYRVMSTDRTCQRAEQLYLNDPEAACGAAAWQALHEVGTALDLDFAGVDFTLKPDGKLFIFEANAAMRHNFDHVPNFPYTGPALETITAAFARMVNERALAPAHCEPVV